MGRKLAVHLGWPAKPSHVGTALESIAQDVQVHWSTWSAGRYLIRVGWVPRQTLLDLEGDSWMGAHLWIAPVERTELSIARGLLTGSLLEQARCWLAKALGESEAWQLSRHERVWVMDTNGAVSFHDDDGMHILDRWSGGGSKYRAQITRGSR